jgi:hypothetical protein
LNRLGKGLEWAAFEARRAIHDNDVERLKTLLAEHRGLLAWRDDEGHPLLQSTTPYAMDVSDPAREAEFCRPDCAAVLIDTGALITPSVWIILIRSAAAGMMALLHEKKVLPRTLAVLAALGDLEGLRACLDEPQGDDRDTVNFAFMSACRFKHEAVATTLLERVIALDPNLGVEIDRWGSRAAFVAKTIAHCPSLYGSTEPWIAFVMRQLLDAMDTDNLPAFTGWLASQAWLLDDSHVTLRVPTRARRRREHRLGHPRAGEHPPRVRGSRQLRGRALPDCARHRPHYPRLSLERDCCRLGAVRGERPRDVQNADGRRGGAKVVSESP